MLCGEFPLSCSSLAADEDAAPDNHRVLDAARSRTSDSNVVCESFMLDSLCRRGEYRERLISVRVSESSVPLSLASFSTVSDQGVTFLLLGIEAARLDFANRVLVDVNQRVDLKRSAGNASVAAFARAAERGLRFAAVEQRARLTFSLQRRAVAGQVQVH